MPRASIKVFQYLITFCLLGFVLYQAGLFSDDGRKELIGLFKGANIYYLLASIALGFVVNLVSSFKWYCLIRSQNMGVSFGRIFAYYVVGQFYNLFLPTSVGGDVVRSYELGKFTGRQADSLASVFVERFTGVLTLLAIAAFAVLGQLSRFKQDFIIFSLIGFAFVLGMMAWLVFDLRPYYWFRQRLTSSFAKLHSIFNKLDRLVEAVSSYRSSKMPIVIAFLNSLLFYFFAVLNVYLTTLIFQLDVGFVDMLIATPIIMLIMNIPLSVGNIGLMEFAYVNVYQIMGYSPSLALSVALTMRFKSLIDGLLGAILQPIFVTQKHE